MTAAVLSPAVPATDTARPAGPSFAKLAGLEIRKSLSTRSGKSVAAATVLLAPLGIEAALRAIDAATKDAGEARRQIELALTQARYEANLARRQYDAVDPDNRLVASELERRWNDCLVEVGRLEERLTAIGTTRPEVVSASEQDRLMTLGTDLVATRRHRAPEPWASRVERHGHGSTAEERIAPEDRAREMLLMGLRLAEGVDAARFAARTGVALADALDADILERATDAGYLVYDGARLAATAEGRMRLDALLPALML